MFVVAEIAMHLNLHQKEPDGRRAKLNGPGEDPYDTSNDEHTVPVPKKGKHLINNENEYNRCW